MNEIFSQLLRVRYESLLASWSKSNNFEEFDNNFVEDAKIIGTPNIPSVFLYCLKYVQLFGFCLHAL